MKDLVIIGAGPTGLYSAFLAGMNQLETVVIEAAADLGGQVTLYKDKAIYDVPGFIKIDGGVMIDALHHQYMQYQDRIPILRDTQATQIIEHDGYYIIETTKGVFDTKTILLANGGGLFKPKPLEIGVDQTYENLYYHIEDIKKFNNQKVVILGGGDSAVDWALSFLNVTKDVYLIHRRHDFRAHLGPVEKIKSTGKVLTPYIIKELITHEQCIKEIVLENCEDKTQKKIELDALMVFYGSIPQRQQVDIWQVETDHKGIKVKSNMETSRKGIYAVGNSIYYPGKLRMIVTGLGEAATAIGAITNQLYPQRKNPYLVK
jgi:ferredoxin/flavodoxin---NADP+ reductase